MSRHLAARSRQKVRSDFMSHPSGTCGLTLRTGLRFDQCRASPVKGSKSNGRAGVEARPSVSTNWLTFPLNTKLAAFALHVCELGLPDISDAAFYVHGSLHCGTARPFNRSGGK